MKLNDLVRVIKTEPHWDSWVVHMDCLIQHIGTVVWYDPNYEGSAEHEGISFIGLVNIEFFEPPYNSGTVWSLPAHCVEVVVDA